MGTYIILASIGVLIFIALQIINYEFCKHFFTTRSLQAVAFGIFALIITNFVQIFYQLPELYIFPALLIFSIMMFKRTFYITIYEAFFLGMFCNYFYLIAKGGVLSLYSILLHLPTSALLSDTKWYISIMISVYVCLIIILRTVRRFVILPNMNKPFYYRKGKIRTLFIELIALTILAVIAFTNRIADTDAHSTFSYPGIFFLFGITGFFFMLEFYLNSIDIAELESYRADSRILEEKLISRSEYYDRFTEDIEKFRNLEHDYSKLVKVANREDKEDVTEQIQPQYLSDFYREFESVNAIKGKYSNNLVIDDLLQGFEDTCKNSNIAMSGKIVLPSQLKINSFEMTRVLINVMDNAVEANLKMPPEKRFITMTTKLLDGWVMFTIENAFSGEIQIENESIITLKKDKRNHGLGLKIVENIVKGWNGNLNIDPDREHNILTIKIALHYDDAQ